ncbi:MAG: sigma-70 family RNA polymerase sigma factor [Pseudomonadota bacterium]
MTGVAVLTVSSPRPAARANSMDSLALNALLVRVAMSADREAFGDLYAYFAPRVKGYLMRNGSTSSELADDLAQETLLKVWRKAKLFDPSKASASTWIFTIARNLRIDAARRASRPQLDPDDPSLLPPEEPRADEVMERASRDERIRASFATLPPNQLEVVQLHFLEDAAHSEIAERLDLPLGTVKSRLRLAFEKIRKELGDLDA